MPQVRREKRKSPVNHVSGLTHIRKCAQCGKTFEIPLLEEWAYSRDACNRGADKRKLFCSWHCLRDNQREHPQLVSQQSINKRERNLEVYRRFIAGESSRALGLAYGVSGSTIISWVEKARNILSEEEIANGTE